MGMLVRAFPLLPGKEGDLEEFARQATARTDEIGEFFGRFGVLRESWHVQRTEHGTWVIGVTELGPPAEVIGPEYAASRHDFDVWFKGRVRELSGIDPDVQPLGPPTECVFEWQSARSCGSGAGCDALTADPGAAEPA